jgi:hypothetical protein
VHADLEIPAFVLPTVTFAGFGARENASALDRIDLKCVVVVGFRVIALFSLILDRAFGIRCLGSALVDLLFFCLEKRSRCQSRQLSAPRVQSAMSNSTEPTAKNELFIEEHLETLDEREKCITKSARSVQQ